MKGPHFFEKRKREMARQEKAKQKAERKAQRKAEKERGEGAGEGGEDGEQTDDEGQAAHLAGDGPADAGEETSSTERVLPDPGPGHEGGPGNRDT